MIYFSVASLVLVLIYNTYQTLKKMREHISKHLEVHTKILRFAFNHLFSVWNVVKRGLLRLMYYLLLLLL